MLSNSIAELDRRHLVHPLASWRAHEQAGARFLASAKGATVIDAEGHSLLDGFAGLWCVNAGYGQDHLIEAATRQLRELPYATGYFGLGSESAARLAGRKAGRDLAADEPITEADLARGLRMAGAALFAEEVLGDQVQALVY